MPYPLPLKLKAYCLLLFPAVTSFGKSLLCCHLGTLLTFHLHTDLRSYCLVATLGLDGLSSDNSCYALLEQEQSSCRVVPMLQLQCAVQHYDWGRVGAESEVGRIHALASGDAIQDVPYAELWMGTHKSGPSLVCFGNETQPVLLKDWLDAHPEALGSKVVEKWQGELPFLFKVNCLFL